MTNATRAPELAAVRSPPRRRWKRLAPTLVAATLATAYVIIAPPSVDLAAQLFRAHLAAQEGLGIWNDYWYVGHSTPGYSVLFGAASAVLSPQLVAAIAATTTAALCAGLVRRHHGDRAWPAAVLFGAATAIDLYTGRLALAFGALPAVGAIVALDRRRSLPACTLAAVAALCSPVAALFAAVAAAGCALGELASTRRVGAGVWRASAVVVAALGPIGMLALAFPEDGTEPFAVLTLVPLLVIAAGALAVLPRGAHRLRAGILVYVLAALAAYVVPSPVGSNIARLGTFAAAPLAALYWHPSPGRRWALGAIVALSLLYVG